MSAPRKILLIDDNANLGTMLGKVIGGFRCGPFEFKHVLEFDAGLRELLSGAYVLCFLDYRLDDRDGLELLRAAKAKNCATPVIMLTGENDASIDLAAMEAGAADFVAKDDRMPLLLERSARYALKMANTLGQLHELATHDELTALFNRREFDRFVREEWERGTRFARPFALVLADIDHFKNVNDLHGHQIGDAVLRHVADLLAGQIRQVDRAARYGGEEFGLIMVETDRAGACEAAERLRIMLAETPCVLPQQHLIVPVTISMGVAICPEDADTPGGLVAAADAALYTAKRLGRNRVVAVQPNLTPMPKPAPAVVP